MPNITETKITSAEIGILWMSYQARSLFKQMIGFFAQKTTEQKAKDILTSYFTNIDTHLNAVKDIFEKENAVIPHAFDSKDVFNDAPTLFDDIFHIMFLRTMAKIKLGFGSVHLAMSFRQDVRNCFVNGWMFSQEVYNVCTDYLTEQGVLARPPYATMPKEVEFIEEKKYMSGMQLFGNRGL